MTDLPCGVRPQFNAGSDTAHIRPSPHLKAGTRQFNSRAPPKARSKARKAGFVRVWRIAAANRPTENSPPASAIWGIATVRGCQIAIKKPCHLSLKVKARRRLGWCRFPVRMSSNDADAYHRALNTSGFRGRSLFQSDAVRGECLLCVWGYQEFDKAFGRFGLRRVRPILATLYGIEQPFEPAHKWTRGAIGAAATQCFTRLTPS